MSSNKRKSIDIYLEPGDPSAPKPVDMVQALMKVGRTIDRVKTKGVTEHCTEYLGRKYGGHIKDKMVKNKGDRGMRNRGRRGQ